MNRIVKLILFLVPATLFAGAGTSGGGSITFDQITLDLIYGTFSLGSSSFDFVSTNVPVIDNQGNDLLTAVDLTTGLDARIYPGIAALMALSATNVSLTAPFATCTTTTSQTCTAVPSGNTTLSVTAPVDDIAFSTGGLGEISDVTDPSQIIGEAEALNLLTGGSLASSTPHGTLTLSFTSTENVPTGQGGFTVESTTTDYNLNLEELDFNGPAPGASAVPEPSSFAPAFIALAVVAFMRFSKYGEAARRMAGPARGSRRFRS